MSILPPLLFGISASLDALLVGIALGLQKVPLPARHNLLISTVTLIGTVISIGLGNLLLPLFPIGIGTRIGSSVLILFGLYYVGKWLLSRWCCNFSPDNNLCQKKKKFAGHRELSLSQILVLGCALSMNNIGIGFSASITDFLSFRHRCPPFSAPSDFWLSEAVWAGLLSCSRSGNIRIPSQVYC